MVVITYDFDAYPAIAKAAAGHFSNAEEALPWVIEKDVPVVFPDLGRSQYLLAYPADPGHVLVEHFPYVTSPKQAVDLARRFLTQKVERYRKK